MTQHNTVKEKLSNSQLNRLKSGITNGTDETLNLSSNVIGDFNDETNFSHKLLLTDMQVSKLHKAFVNNSANQNDQKLNCFRRSFSFGKSGKLKEKIDRNKDIIVPVFDVAGRVEKIWKVMEKC